MGWNNLTIKYLDGIGLNLYGTQLDFRIMYALGENIAQKRPIFYRTDDNERPYITAIPTRPKIGGSNVWDDWETYACTGVNVYMKCPESVYNEDYEYVFALCSTNNDVSYRVYKSNDYSTTMGQFEYNSDEGLAPILLAKDENGNISIIEPNEFGRYETNSVSVPSTAYRNTGEVSYTFDTDFTIQTVFGSPTNYVYEGCAPRFETNCKVFDTEEHARAYLETGATDGLLEEEEEEEDEPTTASGEYFYDVQTSYFNDMGLTDMTSQGVSRLHVTFEDYPTNEYDATTHYEPIVAIVGANNKVSFRIHNGFGQYITSAWYQYGNIRIDIENDVVSTIMGVDEFHYGMGYDTGVDKYIKSHVNTNMVILGGDGSALPTNPTTEDMLANTNNNDFNVGLSECWVLSKSNMIDLAQVFNTTVDRTATGSGEYVVAEWITGLSAYSSPLDVICDLFALPISIDGFCDTTADAFSFNN